MFASYRAATDFIEGQKREALAQLDKTRAVVLEINNHHFSCRAVLEALDTASKEVEAINV